MNSRIETDTVHSSKQGIKQSNKQMHSNKEYKIQPRKIGGNIENEITHI